MHPPRWVDATCSFMKNAFFFAFASVCANTQHASMAISAQDAHASDEHEEHQYLNLIRQILTSGQLRGDRTGTGTISVFAPPHLDFSLSDSTLPLLTTKRVFTRGVIEELLWFIRGATDATSLSDRGVKIWDGNSSREFLENRGLGHYKDGELGPIYGFQWRHFGAEWKGADVDYSGQGVDQLARVIDTIKTNPTDRRIILTAWNPADLDKMVLPPCHMTCQFYVTLPDSESSPDARPLLSCFMYQRSADIGLGVPFNIASYALLTHMIAKVTDTEAHRIVLQLGDAHVYKNHVEPLQGQLERDPRPFPKLEFTRDVKDIDDFKYEDFSIVGYSPHPKIEMQMSVSDSYSLAILQ